jgi:hypothetical protein
MGKVLHASGSGYFPSCILAGEPEDCPWTLEKAMQTYWRVRTWEFEASGRLQDKSKDFPPYSFSLTASGITSVDAEEIPHTLEEGLVCYNSFLGGGAEIYFTQPEKSGNLYNSGLFGAVITFANTGDEMEFGFSAKNVNEYNLEILGVNIPMSAFVIDDDPEIGVDVISATATLTPTLWWSYGGTYDTATGEPL